MLRYFLHLRYPDLEDGLAHDEEGDELEDASALRQHVMVTARDLMKGARLQSIPNWRRCSFEVTDESGTVVLLLAFAGPVK
jgi:hypothetical protein